MKKLLTLLLSASAAVLAAGNFTLDPDGTVLLHGKKLVADEKVNVLSKVYNISDVAPEITKHNVKGKSVVNRLGKDEKLLPFRRAIDYGRVWECMRGYGKRAEPAAAGRRTTPASYTPGNASRHTQCRCNGRQYSHTFPYSPMFSHKKPPSPMSPGLPRFI